VEALGEVRDNEKIKAAVIRIDSPGGSAIASEMIWQAVREVGEEKPIFVSVGGMAASGGYYIACAGDQVYVSDTSVLGSIGVVGGKITMGGLYEWAGVSVHQRTRGPLGGMFNSVTPFTDQERAILASAFEKTYDTFVDRVQEGRGKRIAEVDAVAQGRIFTGRQCVDNGMADQIGGLADAITDVAQQAGLEPGEYEVIDFPRPMTLPEFLDDLFRAQSPQVQVDVTQAHPALGMLKKAMGPVNWQRVAHTMDALLLLQEEPVIAVSPSVLIVR